MESAANIYNNLILGYVIFIFNKLNFFELLNKGITNNEISKKYKYDSKMLKGLIAVATKMGLIKEKNNKLSLTKLGKDVEKNRGFFTWAIGGYSPLLEEMDTFLINPDTSWQPYVRGKYVAIGSDEANQGLMQDIFDKVIDGFDSKCIADLGCGNAGRLINLILRKPQLTGVGIDINPQAIEAAKENIKKNKLNKKIDLICENVFTSLTKTNQELSEVELVMSFMMLHDLFNIQELKGNLFTKMKKAFPKAKYFVFADTCLEEKSYDPKDLPIFTIGYELIHQMRRIKLYPVEYYKKQFKKEGLELIAQHDFGVPNTYLFVLKVK